MTFSSDSRKDALKKRIIEGAEGLFGRYGYAKTTVDEIARAAGMSKATLYKVIRRKEDALTLVIRAEANKMFGRIRSATDTGTPAEKLRALAIALAEDVQQMFVLRDVNQQAFDELEPHMQKEIRWLADEMARMVAQILEEGVACGEFRPLDPQTMGMAIALGLKELVMHWNVNLTKLNVKEVMGHMIDLMLYGLLERKESS